MIKFSIIIPCYNAEPYIHELLDCLDKQINPEVEVILIDDGSKVPLKPKHKWVKLIRQPNKGISGARNKGLNMAKGEAIGFIDADDIVSEKYVSFVLDALYDKTWDYIDLSWKSLEDDRFYYKLNDNTESLPNPSACTRIFRRKFIGDTRFSEIKDAAEDEDFTRHLDLSSAKHICSTEFMYYYRTETPNSNSKRYLADGTKTKRIAYFFKYVTKDMDYLIEEFKKEDEVNEVFLLTYRNDLPELKKYCQIWSPPKGLRANERRGEPNSYITVVPRLHKTQVVIYTSDICEIGGTETFIYNFCKQMHKLYDITVLYDAIGAGQLARLSEIVQTMHNDTNRPVHCDTLIMNRIGDKVPRNITYKQTIQMVHCIKQQPNWHIPQDRDYIVNVSNASKNSFKEEAEKATVIHNLTLNEKVPKALILVSALRIGAEDKQGNDSRCVKFANMLDNAGIKYTWLYFGNRAMRNEPQNMFYCGLRHDIKPFIAKADYLVQLSGSEAFSYSLIEALELRTPVIVTPLDQNEDMKIVDGENAYIVPFEVDGFDVKKILKIPKFEYRNDNANIIKQWRKLLGDSKPEGGYTPKKEVRVEVITEYRDIQLNKIMKVGEKVVMKFGRALELESKGFVRLLE